MFRKTMIALAATVALGAAALAPTSASAWHGGFHGHHGFHGGFGWRGGFGITVVNPGVSCYQYRWVETYRGLRRALVNVCAY